MKKFLACFGAFTIFASSASAVVACANNTENNGPTDQELYDNSAEVKNITTNAVDRLKSIILSDQFGISDKVYADQIVKYNKKSQYETLFNAESANKVRTISFKLDGRGGESNILLKELLELITNGIGGIDLGGIDLGGILSGLDLDKTIDDWGPIITGLPAFVVDLPIQQLVALISVVLTALSSFLPTLIKDFDPKLIDGLAETIPTAIKAFLKSYGIRAFLDQLNAGTKVDNYKDLTFENLSTTLWMSMLTTVGYGLNPDGYVSNPTTELNPDNAVRLTEKFSASISKTAITPKDGEEKEMLGVVKYAVSTIKILELYLQFHGEEFFSYVPDVNDWTAADGNAHLFNGSTKNPDYFKNLDSKKVSDLPGAKDGINLAFLSRTLKTFLSNDNDKANGAMFQKFLFALVGNYDSNGKFVLPVWHNILIHLLDNVPKAFLIKLAINQVVAALEGALTNRTAAGLLALISLADKFVPDEYKPIVDQIKAFLETGPGREFINKPFDYLWKGNITLILPSILQNVADNLKVDNLNLSNFIYNVKIPNLLKLLGAENNKYGDSYITGSLADLIKKLDFYWKTDSLTYEETTNNNLNLDRVDELLKILLDENPIVLDDNEDHGIKPIYSHSLLRQFISNLEYPEILAKIFGLKIREKTDTDPEERVEVVVNSFMGTFLRFIYPNISSTDSTVYSYEDLKNTQGFNQRFFQGVGHLLSSLLEGKDFNYLIQPLVTNQKIWTIESVENSYFKDSQGQLMSQMVKVSFDPTGVVLEDGSVVDNTHKAVYVLSFQRWNQQEQFVFREVLKQRGRGMKI